MDRFKRCQKLPWLNHQPIDSDKLQGVIRNPSAFHFLDTKGVQWADTDATVVIGGYTKGAPSYLQGKNHSTQI